MRLWILGIFLIIALGGGFLLINGVVADELVNINTANQQEMETLSGIGPTKAQAIIDYRNENGPFEVIEEIMNVSGIGPATFDKIKDFITVGESSGQQNNEIKIVINELLPNPAGSDDFEWIELKNVGSSEVNLEGWKIGDLSKEYTISGDDFSSTLILAGGFFVLNKEITNIALNNSGGETVRLYNTEGGLASEVSYSESAKDDTSWARDESGGYGWTVSLTKGDENIIEALTGDESEEGEDLDEQQETSTLELETGENKYSDYKDIVLINEFFPNPFGIDNEEWIEFYNTSTRAVDLDSWKLKDNQSEYAFKDIKIGAKDFLVLNRAETGLIMNNTGGDFLELIDNYGKQVEKVSYKKKAIEGESYNWCFNLNKWIWLAEVTPKEHNKCPLKNKEPMAYFEIEGGELEVNDYIWLDASESYDKDKDGKIVKYIWEFDKDVFILGKVGKVFEFIEPRVEIKFLDSGEQKINLRVIDNLEGEDDYSLKVVLEKKIGEVDFESIYINKFLPDPEGTDSEEEWIEICSKGDDDIDLAGFSLDDEEGGSKPYGLDDYILPAGSCILIFRMDSKIALNNDEDSVRLLDNQCNLIEEVVYRDAVKGFVYSRAGSGEWRWLGWDEGYYNGTSEFIFGLVDLRELRDIAQGSLVKVKGFVATEPGLMGKTIFYIIDGNSGVQIYFYKKDFPDLAIGDFIEVNGELSESQGETRIKIKERYDIIKLGEGKPPSAIKVQIEDIGEEIEGALVEFRGELTEIKGSSWWLDDTTEEVKVYIKQNTQIKKGDIKIGDSLEITGLVSEWKGEYRILPRFPDDVKVISKILGNSTENTSLGQGFGEASKNTSTDNLFKYLLVVAVAIVIILVSVIIRMKEKKKVD